MPEKKLRLTEAKLNVLLNHAGDAIFLIDENHLITEANQSACGLLGYTREEFLGLKMSDLFPQDELARYQERTDAVDEIGGSVHERKFQHKNGTMVTTEVNVRAVAGVGYIAIARDISARKAEEEARIQSEERYRSIIAVSNTGGWEYHSETNFLWCSPEYFRMLGRNVEDYDFSGKGNLKETWQDLLHPSDRQRATDQFSEYLKGGSVGTYDSYFRMLHSNGDWIWIWSRGQTLHDGKGNLTAITVGTHINITERKKVEEQLKERESQLDTIFENLESSLGLIDTNKRIVLFNKRFAENYQMLTGQQPRIGQGVYEGFTDEMKEAPSRLMDSALKGKKEVFENDYVSEGKLMRLRAYYIPVINGGKVTGVITSSIDLTTNRENEVKLEKSEEKFRLAFMASRDAFYIGTLAEGRILDVNHSFTTVFGYTREEAIGKTVLELNIYANPDERARIVKELSEDGSLKDTELTCRKKSGELMSTSISANAMEMNGEKCVLAVVRDVTRRKRAELDLLESEIRFREVLENSVSASYKRNLVTNAYDYLSPVFKKIAGYVQEELNLMPLNVVIGLMHPEDVPTVNAGIVKALGDESGSANFLEYRFRHKDDDQYRWLRDEFVVRRDAKGIPVALIGSVSDITAQKESELRFKNLVEESPFGVYIIQNRKFVYVNSKFEKILGYSTSQLQSMSDTMEIVCEEELPNAEEQYRRRVEDGAKNIYMELKYRAKDGREVWGSVHSATTLYNGAEAVIGTLQDISERKLLELEREKTMSQLEQRNKALEQFSYIVSHNLRAPVSTIVGMTDALLSMELKPEDQERMIGGVRTSAHKLNAVIEDLNTILKVESGTNQQKEQVRFSELIDDVKASLSSSVENDSVKFVCDFSAVDEIPSIKSYLYSVFHNLISNSIKYRQSSVDPVLEIRSEIKNGSTILYFRDNGLGIDLTKKGGDVFGLYKRFHTHVEGKGIGLFMVKTQLEAIGGKISIESEVNVGTVFRIEFQSEKIPD